MPLKDGIRAKAELDARIALLDTLASAYADHGMVWYGMVDVMQSARQCVYLSLNHVLPIDLQYNISAFCNALLCSHAPPHPTNTRPHL